MCGWGRGLCSTSRPSYDSLEHSQQCFKEKYKRATGYKNEIQKSLKIFYLIVSMTIQTFWSWLTLDPLQIVEIFFCPADFFLFSLKLSWINSEESMVQCVGLGLTCRMKAQLREHSSGSLFKFRIKSRGNTFCNKRPTFCSTFYNKCQIIK